MFQVVKEVDPDAFMTFGNVMGVYGLGFEALKNKPVQLQARIVKCGSSDMLCEPHSKNVSRGRIPARNFPPLLSGAVCSLRSYSAGRRFAILSPLPMGHAVNGLLFHSWQSCLCQIRRINSSSRGIVMAVLYHPKSLSRPDPLIQIQRHMEIMQSIGHFDGICTCWRGPLSRCRFDFACTITSIPQMAPRLQSSWIFGGRHRQSSQASCLSRSPDTQILQSITSNYTQAPSALGNVQNILPYIIQNTSRGNICYWWMMCWPLERHWFHALKPYLKIHLIAALASPP